MAVSAMRAIGALRVAATRAPSSLRLVRPGLVVRPASVRMFSAGASKVAKVLESELKHEEGQYEKPKEVQNFLKNSPFKFVEAEGDVNMALERQMGDKTIRIEFQLSTPMLAEEEGEEADHESTELSISVDGKDGSGITFYCSTQAGEDHRYVIGNVKTYASAEEKDSVSSYNGPDFEDLDEKLQESLDEYLAEVGMSTEVCDFVDAMASDKEQREYVRWLKLTKKFMES
eukprot:TRINITY_DN977_c0_g1_i2.p1 TRINITY_DN977_c0_g1~~TRINITY_DN977_c0_g1_i2.p1  ORF type:complete len:246 (-),score=76.28 TRINITY_DN977_c0_g1_i2:42-731(-)